MAGKSREGLLIEDLPIYEGEVPIDQEIPRINKDGLKEVEFHIAIHPDKFDYDFTTDNVSENEKKERENKIIEAICSLLKLSPDDPLVPKYLEAILKQLRKGLSYESAENSRSGGERRRDRDAQANDFRASKRGGI